MARYRVSGTTAATAATDQHAIAAVWNPSATKRIALLELSLVATAAPAAGAGLLLRRLSARGTAGSTVTPTLEFADQHDAAPDSGWVLDLAAYTAQPTIEAGDLWGWVLAAVAASGVIYPIQPPGIVIPPGTGIALVNRAAVAMPISEVSVVIED